jgi:hypothetical protein
LNAEEFEGCGEKRSSKVPKIIVVVLWVVLLIVGFVAIVEVLWCGEKSLKGRWGRRKKNC